jgi:ubiquinone biosynthesis protein COQ9
MTEPKTRKPRARRKPPADDDAALKAAVLEAALPHVPFDGFTDKVLAEAAAEAGLDKISLARLFPGRPAQSRRSVLGQHRRRDGKTPCEAQACADENPRPHQDGGDTRLALLAPHKEAARRAAAFLTLPPHAAMGAKLLYRTVDTIWRAIGDTSTDFNFYTKRAILAAVYSATLMRWFTDDSEVKPPRRNSSRTASTM